MDDDKKAFGAASAPLRALRVEVRGAALLRSAGSEAAPRVARNACERLSPEERMHEEFEQRLRRKLAAVEAALAPETCRLGRALTEEEAADLRLLHTDLERELRERWSTLRNLVTPGGMAALNAAQHTEMLNAGGSEDDFAPVVRGGGGVGVGGGVGSAVSFRGLGLVASGSGTSSSGSGFFGRARRQQQQQHGEAEVRSSALAKSKAVHELMAAQEQKDRLHAAWLERHRALLQQRRGDSRDGDRVEGKSDAAAREERDLKAAIHAADWEHEESRRWRISQMPVFTSEERALLHGTEMMRQVRRSRSLRPRSLKPLPGLRDSVSRARP